MTVQPGKGFTPPGDAPRVQINWEKEVMATPTFRAYMAEARELTAAAKYPTELLKREFGRLSSKNCSAEELRTLGAAAFTLARRQEGVR